MVRCRGYPDLKCIIERMSRYEDFLRKASAEYIQHDRFLSVRDEVLAEMEKRRFFDAKGVFGEGGFGVLAEKSMHAVLKRFAEPDDNFHEVAMEGFFADICRDGKVTEIQTKRLGNLRKKLDVFLKSYEVTVIYPVICNKWRGYSETFDKRPSSFRLSSHHRNEYSAFDELYALKGKLAEPNLHIHLYLMDAEEIMVKQEKAKGRRRARSGYERFDLVPLGIRRIIELDSANDYMQFMPEADGQFTSADFAAEAGISRGTASLVLNVLLSAGVVERVGKKGNFYLYEAAY